MVSGAKVVFVRRLEEDVCEALGRSLQAVTSDTISARAATLVPCRKPGHCGAGKLPRPWVLTVARPEDEGARRDVSGAEGLDVHAEVLDWDWLPRLLVDPARFDGPEPTEPG